MPYEQISGELFALKKVVALLRLQVESLIEDRKPNDCPTLEEVEKRVILERLAYMANHRGNTAKSLGIGMRTLQSRLTTYSQNP